MDNKTSYEPPVAVLQVHNDKELDYATTEASVSSSNNSSSRSSISSFDSNHDHAAPLELGLVINALQTSLTEQQQQEEEQEEERPVETHVTANQSVSSPRPTSVAVTDVLPAVTFGSKGLKREEAVIVDYELDHGATSTSRESNTTGSANVIVLDCIDPKSVKPNNLTPREQEKAGNKKKTKLMCRPGSKPNMRIDEPVLRAMHHLFSNRFMKAKRLFEQQAQR